MVARYGTASTAAVLGFCVWALVGAQHACASTGANARSMGMAGAYTALGRNLDAVDWNPANLSLPARHRFHLGFVLLPTLIAGAGNDVLSGDLIRDYEGKYLTEADKQEILDRFDDGIGVYSRTRLDFLGVSAGPMAYKEYARADLSARIPDLPLRVLLDGLREGDRLSLGTLSAKMQIVNVSSFSYARPLHAHALLTPHLEKLPVPVGHLSAGTTVKLLRGTSYLDVTATRGQVAADEYSTNVDARMEVRTAGLPLDFNESTDDTDPLREGEEFSARGALLSPSGWGLGVDLGLSAVLRDDITVGMVLTNALGFVRWSGDTYRGTVIFEADSVNVVSVSQDTTDGDSLYTVTTSSGPVGSFTTDLPTFLSVGGAYAMKVTSEAHHWLSEGVTFSADFRTSSGRLGGSGKPLLALGVENRLLWGHLPVRCGVVIGAKQDRAACVGMGVHFDHFQWDLAVANRGSIFGAPMGSEAATMFRIAF